MQVRATMIGSVAAMAPGAGSAEYAKLLAERNVSGAPVVDAEKNVPGIVSERDLIRGADRSNFKGRRAWRLPWAGMQSEAQTDAFEVAARKVPDIRNVENRIASVPEIFCGLWAGWPMSENCCLNDVHQKGEPE